MMEQYQIDGLNKLVNSSVIKSVYPMVDRIEISQDGEFGMPDGKYYRLDIDIHLNNPDIDKDNMYDMGFDPFLLIHKRLKKYLPYFNIDKVIIDFIVWGPEGNVIGSFVE
jgi:hypothetical protein